MGLQTSEETETSFLFECLINLDFLDEIASDEPEPRLYRRPYEYVQNRVLLQNFYEGNCIYHFRFTRRQICYLTEQLQLDSIEWRNRYKPDNEVALCIFLNKMAFPRLYRDMSDRFGRSASYLSSVFNDVAIHLLRTFGELLKWRPALNSYRKLKEFAKAINTAGCEYAIWGFIDGTFNAFYRPKGLKESTIRVIKSCEV